MSSCCKLAKLLGRSPSIPEVLFFRLCGAACGPSSGTKEAPRTHVSLERLWRIHDPSPCVSDPVPAATQKAPSTNQGGTQKYISYYESQHHIIYMNAECWLDSNNISFEIFKNMILKEATTRKVKKFTPLSEKTVAFFHVSCRILA